MDHESALRAANQALSGSALREANHFPSVELHGVGELKRSGKPAAPPDSSSSLPIGTWELAAMLSVGVATLLFLLGVWFL